MATLQSTIPPHSLSLGTYPSNHYTHWYTSSSSNQVPYCNYHSISTHTPYLGQPYFPTYHPSNIIVSTQYFICSHLNYIFHFYRISICFTGIHLASLSDHIFFKRKMVWCARYLLIPKVRPFEPRCHCCGVTKCFVRFCTSQLVIVHIYSIYLLSNLKLKCQIRQSQAWNTGMCNLVMHLAWLFVPHLHCEDMIHQTTHICWSGPLFPNF